MAFPQDTKPSHSTPNVSHPDHPSQNIRLSSTFIFISYYVYETMSSCARDQDRENENENENEKIFNVNLIYQFRFSLGLAPYPLK